MYILAIYIIQGCQLTGKIFMVSYGYAMMQAGFAKPAIDRLYSGPGVTP